MAKPKDWLKILLDIFVLASVGVTIILSLWVEPSKRSFFYKDLSLYLPHKTKTVSAALLAGIGFVLMVFTILIVERLRKRPSVKLWGHVIPGWACGTCRTVRVFTFGAACQHLICNLAQYVIGGLRPHFMDICQPSWNSTAPSNILGYITDYTCQNADDELLKDVQLSFPCTQSSFAMYCAIFFFLYIQDNGEWWGLKLLHHVVQSTVVMAAWYVGLLRVVDHMNHSIDVATGFLVGAVFAVLVFEYILKQDMDSETDHCRDGTSEAGNNAPRLQSDTKDPSAIPLMENSNGNKGAAIARSLPCPS